MSTSVIAECEARLRAAQMSNDVEALDTLVDDALVFTLPDGSLATKADDLAAHRARRLRLTRMVPSEYREVSVGAVIVVSVRMDVEGTYDGAPLPPALRYTRVWAERPGGWRIVAGHVGVVQPSEGH